MGRKRLMLLGGIRYLLPVIEAAHREGYYVITVDNVPGNIAHRFSDRYMNISVTDQDAVLNAAAGCGVDGILSFACDPGVVTASFVQNTLGLPSIGPYDSVRTLQNKNLFRKFLQDNGFNVPFFAAFSTVEEALSIGEGVKYPVIVKPVDSAGSKGVSMACSIEELKTASADALNRSLSGRGIIESVVEASGCPSDSDCYVENGILKFSSFSSQYFDPDAENPFTPAAFCWPSSFTAGQENSLISEIRRIVSLLKINTSLFNVESRIGVDGKPYIMEMSPRGGGNRLCEMLHHSYGVDLISPAVRWAVGDDPSFNGNIYRDGFWGEIVLHSRRSGVYRGVSFSGDVRDHIVEKVFWVSPGDSVSSFLGANASLGTIVLRYEDEALLRGAIADQSWLKVEID